VISVTNLAAVAAGCLAPDGSNQSALREQHKGAALAANRKVHDTGPFSF